MNTANISVYLSEILGLLCAEGSYLVQYSTYYGKDKGKIRLYIDHKSERIEFYNKDMRLLRRLKWLLEKEFDYDANITKGNKISICKRKIIRKILSYTELSCSMWKVPDEVIDSTRTVKIAFIRGFFDGDGTCSKYIRMFSINKHALEQISSLLKDLDTGHYFEKPLLKKNRNPLYTIHIHTDEKEKFLNIIQPISKLPRHAGVILK